jgi:hypothetical protein
MEHVALWLDADVSRVIGFDKDRMALADSGTDVPPLPDSE